MSNLEEHLEEHIAVEHLEEHLEELYAFTLSDLILLIRSWALDV